MAEWQTRASRAVYENPWISVREDEVVRPDGTPGIYGVVTVRHPAVFVVAVTERDEVLLVRQHRYTVGLDSLEVPAGATDGEDPLVAGRRELLEETGYEAGSWRVLGEVYSLNGVTNAPGFVVLAEDLTRVAEPGQLAEEGIIGVAALPWPAVLDLVRRGEIHDGETLAALLHGAVALGKLG